MKDLSHWQRSITFCSLTVGQNGKTRENLLVQAGDHKSSHMPTLGDQTQGPIERVVTEPAREFHSLSYDSRHFPGNFLE